MTRASLFAACVLGFGPPSAAQSAYTEIDNVQGSFVNLATFPVRPMLFDPSSNLWAINHHDSTIQKFTGINPNPVATYGVPWGPVAIAYWRNDADPGNQSDELIVVCRGSWVVLRMSMTTGEILGTFQPRPGDPVASRLGAMAEPADILVDAATNRAFVSCPGADSVIQLDLATNQIERVYSEATHSAFRCKSPTFLSWGPTPGTVLVSPLISGNDTIVPKAGAAVFTQTERVESLAALAAANPGLYSSLPDDDLFLIDPSGATGSVTVPVHGTGTILFAHGLNPNGNAFWQLNTDAHNAPAGVQGEPNAKGIFASNRVTIVSSPFTTPTKSFVGLDPGDPGITTANTVGQPFGLTFHSVSTSAHYGKAFITGLLSDNVVVLNANGTFNKSWDLPAGSIPRAVILDRSSNYALVYCWGDNKVRLYNWSTATGLATPTATYDLGFDPAPLAVKQGRALFFSADKSQNKNLSCATCHVEGGSDFLAWNLSNLPQDDKGPMVTQTLVGLERLAPFHWRGERGFKDFNGAFVGLLGNATKLDETPGGELDQLQAFVFSLKNPANPFQNRERILDDTIHDPQSLSTAKATTGQASFRNVTLFTRGDTLFTCQNCHQQPTGTGNDIFRDVVRTGRPARNHFKAAPFHELWRKRQSQVTIQFNSVTPNRATAFLGTGTSHAGLLPGLFEFVGSITANPDQSDVADFLTQWDQGLAPAVHYVQHVDATSTSQAAFQNEVADAAGTPKYLMLQAQAANCDIAVIGMSWDPNANALVARRWFWDRRSTVIPGVTGAFLCEQTSASFPPRTANDFRLGALNHGERNAFVGLPVGMAERWAVDYDLDARFNRNESGTEYTSNPISDGVAPVFLSSAHVTWKTTNSARLFFDTDEPSIATISYVEPGSAFPAQVVVSGPTRNHSVLLTGLRPSTTTASPHFAAETVPYQATISIVDVAGNGPTLRTSNLTSDGFIESTTGFQPDPSQVGYDFNDRILHEAHVVDQVDMQPLGGSSTAQVDFKVGYKRGPRVGTLHGPANERVIVGRVMVRRLVSGVLGPVQVLPASSVTAASDSALYDVVKVGSVSASRALNVDVGGGKFVVTHWATGENSQPAGVTQLHVTVSGVNTGDELYFNVDAVVEVTSQSALNTALGAGGTTLILPTENAEAFDLWDFPATTEKHASDHETF